MTLYSRTPSPDAALMLGFNACKAASREIFQAGIPWHRSDEDDDAEEEDSEGDARYGQDEQGPGGVEVDFLGVELARVDW